MNALQPFWGLVKRELIRDLRRPRPFAVFAGLALIAAFVVYGSYPSNILSPFELSRRSLVIFGGLTSVLYAAALFVLPGYAATAIVVEREQDTFDLLSLTLTRPAAIIAGKCVSALGYFVLLVLAMLPFLGASFFIVGIDSRHLVLVAINLFVTATTCVCAGVVASALVKSTPRAVTLSYACAFTMLIGYVIPFAILTASFSIWQLNEIAALLTYVLAFLVALSPFSSIGAFATPGFTILGSWYSPLGVVLGQGTFCFIALLIAWKMIRRPSLDRNFSTVPLTEPPELPTEPGCNVSYSDSLLPPWPPVPDRVNPMYAREMLQARISHRITPLRLLGAMAFVVPVMFILAVTLSENFRNIRPQESAVVVTVWLTGLMIFMAFVAPAMSATAWSHEYERETMDLIRTSLLTPRQLVLGKTRAAFAACAFPLILACIASLPLFPYALAGARALMQFILGIVSIGVTTLLCNAIGTLVGLLNRRSATCILYGYVSTMTALALPFLFAIFEMLVRTITTGRPIPGNPVEYWFFSPIVSYGATFNLGEHYAGWWASAMAFHVISAVVILSVAVSLLAKRHMAER